MCPGNQPREHEWNTIDRLTCTLATSSPLSPGCCCCRMPQPLEIDARRKRKSATCPSREPIATGSLRQLMRSSFSRASVYSLSAESATSALSGIALHSGPDRFFEPTDRTRQEPRLLTTASVGVAVRLNTKDTMDTEPGYKQSIARHSSARTVDRDRASRTVWTIASRTNPDTMIRAFHSLFRRAGTG